MPMPCRPRYAMLLFYLAIHIPMFRIPCPHIRPPYFSIPYPPSHVTSHTLPPYPLSLAQSTKTPSCIRRQKKNSISASPPKTEGAIDTETYSQEDLGPPTRMSSTPPRHPIGSGINVW